MIANRELAVGAGEGTVGGEAVQSGTCSLLGEGSASMCQISLGRDARIPILGFAG